jgi:hypothetical protein
MRTRALLGGLFFVAIASACGGAKGLPKGPPPEYEEDPALDAAAPTPPPAPTAAAPAAGAGDAAAPSP